MSCGHISSDCHSDHHHKVTSYTKLSQVAPVQCAQDTGAAREPVVRNYLAVTNSFDVCRYYQQESDMIRNIFVLLTFTYCSEALKCIICVSV